MNCKILPSIHPEIVSMYKSGCSSYKIAKKYKVQSKTISNILKKYIKQLRGFNEKCSKDESYFEKIDTQEKAYWLGFLYADGYNSGNGVVLSLQKSDLDIIKRFQKDIKSTSKIYFIEKEQMSLKSNNVQGMACLSVSSKKISKDLSNLGCVKKKSLILKFPTPEQVPDNLMNHFIRGYFDGDGCCCVSKHNGLFLSFTSSKDFCSGLKNFLFKSLGINTYQNKKQNNSSESLYVGGFNKIKKLYDYIYNNASFYMERKHNKFLEGFKRKSEKEEVFLNKKHSKYFGVTWHKRKEKWEAFSCKSGKTINLGAFDTEMEAALKYNEFAKNNGKRLNILIDKTNK